MKQFGTILGFELKYYLKNKIFIGITVFLVVLIAGVMFFPRVSALFESDEAPEDGSSVGGGAVMLVKADDQATADTGLDAFAMSFVHSAPPSDARRFAG